MASSSVVSNLDWFFSVAFMRRRSRMSNRRPECEKARRRYDSPPAAARPEGCLWDQFTVSVGQSSGTNAGGLVQGSSTNASWNHCSRRFACSVTISWKPGTSSWVNFSNNSNNRRTASRSASASVYRMHRRLGAARWQGSFSAASGGAPGRWQGPGASAAPDRPWPWP